MHCAYLQMVVDVVGITVNHIQTVCHFD